MTASRPPCDDPCRAEDASSAAIGCEDGTRVADPEVVITDCPPLPRADDVASPASPAALEGHPRAALTTRLLRTRWRATPASRWRWWIVSFAVHGLVLLALALAHSSATTPPRLDVLVAMNAMEPADEEIVPTPETPAPVDEEPLPEPELEPIPVLALPPEVPPDAPDLVPREEDTLPPDEETVPTVRIVTAAPPPDARVRRPRPIPEPPPPRPPPPPPAVVRSPSTGIVVGAVPLGTNQPPVFPAAARRDQREGDVRLRLWISPAGDVTRAEVVESSGYADLDQAAVDAALRWRFRPATRDGVAVEFVARQTVQFRLDA